MYLSLAVSYWLTLGFALVAGGVLVRVFIIFHDCGHQSYFKSSKANRFWGFLTGVLTLLPMIIGGMSMPSTTRPPAIWTAGA